MIRNVARKAVFLAAATLCMGVLAVNCSHFKDNGGSTPETGVGDVGLALTLPGGGIVSTVHYSLKNTATPAVEVRSGDISVTGAGATVSIVIGAVPTGDYTVSLSATATDGTMCGGSSGTFHVSAGVSTSVNVLLICRATGTTGTVIVNGVNDACPVITSYSVSPLAVAAGGQIAVMATGTDPDVADTVTYAWTATAGTFTAPGLASTTFNCPATSTQVTLTLTLSDGSLTLPGDGGVVQKCTTPQTIIVACGLCGNGVTDTAAGEQCDPPNGTTCNSSCQNIPIVCGNGIVQPGEQCEPPNTATCSATCQTLGLVCGNGIVQPPEQCEPPNTASCDSMCRNIVCGNGIVQPGEQCDPPAAGTCSSTCQTIMLDPSGASLACKACEDTGTGSTTVPPSACVGTLARCDNMTGANQTLCYAALACMRTAHCAVNGDASFCYCSAAHQALGTCTSGGQDGPCVTALEAADTNITAADNTPALRSAKAGNELTDPTLPMGRAVGQIGCDNLKCNTVATCGGMF